ncbi:hypothetical protein FisN_8Lh105 [Fistulifera solaris]|uniref:Heterogeneous nuclear ribonucleoprotein Q acidic domain-containing protein n=1 Tax=Fistulifera solaris TaxID=1519565 RepID=A0A1Z5JE30_FISSO|nr:hypothetical protein FisN_8Lh105 [Fistulifera solaris]|eukprot:GAX12011.1 hypothetical protein FisN_8Lh105 [Fistulifera solaris]
MVDETTNQSSPEKVETVIASSIQKEPDDEEEEDLFEAGDDDIATNQEPVSSTSVNSQRPASTSIASVATAPSPNNQSSPSLSDIPIPHKSPTARQTTPASTLPTPPLPTTSIISSNHTFLDPASFDLPPGVKIPKSVTGALLRQGKLLEILKTLPTQSINDALTEYDDAVDVKGSGIRNHGAYLYGVVKRYQSVITRAQQSGQLEILPMGHHITPAVHHRLELLVSTGFCTRDEMDEKVRSKIRMLSEKDALLALDELSSVERTSIRNFGSYFMGILNRYMRGDAPSSSSSSKPRGREPSYRDPKSTPSYTTRERSRDRMETRHEIPNKYAPSYDDRHRPHPMPPPQQQPQSMYSSSMTYNPPGMNNMIPPNGRIMDAYGSGMNQAANRRMNDTYGYNQGPNMYPPAYGAPPPPPPHMMNPPQQQQQMMMMNPPAQQMMHSQPQQLMNPQQPPQMMNSQQTPFGAATSQPSNYGNWQQSSANPGLSVDIFGLADKAASAVQALANQNGMQQSNMPYLQNTMSNYGGMNPPYNPGMPQPAYPANTLQQYPPTEQHHSGRSGRRTTATLGQLTPSVQYLVQSIQTSGAVEGPLDDGILGMIHDLPENMAVAALQRFVSIDKTTMRNKTAYLAGILRRELETIKKR